MTGHGGLAAGWAADQRRRGLLESTVHRRGDMLASWLRWCTLHELDPLTATEADVDAFIDAKRVGSRTRYTWISALAVFYAWAIRSGLATSDPTALMVRPKLRRTLPRPISDADLAMALDLSRGQQVHHWFLLASLMGLRCAEIAGIQRDDVMVDRGRLRVTGKGAKERLIPIHADVADALDAWPKPRQNRHLYQRPAGGPWPPALLSRTASVWLHENGIDATLHQFRHWFGTNTLRVCKDLRIVQELMGHASPTTTAIYTAFSDDDAEAAVKALTRPTSSAQPSLFA